MNITIRDLERGRWEVHKDALLDRFMSKRAIIGDPLCGWTPNQVVPSELLTSMAESFQEECGVIVVQADGGLGKSIAAKSILKHSAGGIMFCNCRSACNPSYWKGVARTLGIPDEISERNDRWQELLVDAVAAAASPKESETPAWTERLLDGILSTCNDSFRDLSSHSSADPPTIPGLDVSLVQQRPMMVFDDFNDADTEDILFMRHLFPIVDGRNILLFVMVRDTATANRLIGLNGWCRIKPLDGTCENPEDPHWRVIEWTAEQLQEMVVNNVGSIPENMPEITSGQNPRKVAKKAELLSKRS